MAAALLLAAQQIHENGADARLAENGGDKLVAAAVPAAAAAVGE